MCYRGDNIFDADIDVNELRRSIGMVFQKPNPFPMSIYDNIAYGPRTHGIKNKAKLDDIVEHSPAWSCNLGGSKGQAEKIGIRIVGEVSSSGSALPVH